MEILPLNLFDLSMNIVDRFFVIYEKISKRDMVEDTIAIFEKGCGIINRCTNPQWKFNNLKEGSLVQVTYNEKSFLPSFYTLNVVKFGTLENIEKINPTKDMNIKGLVLKKEVHKSNGNYVTIQILLKNKVLLVSDYSWFYGIEVKQL